MISIPRFRVKTITARAEAEAARAEIANQLATIEEQRTVTREMSVPILPLTATTMVMPLVGTLDSARLRLVQQQALHTIEQTRAPSDFGRHRGAGY
jgi:rsbT co-antagonist protein RsbR